MAVALHDSGRRSWREKPDKLRMMPCTNESIVELPTAQEEEQVTASVGTKLCHPPGLDQDPASSSLQSTELRRALPTASKKRANAQGKAAESACCQEASLKLADRWKIALKPTQAIVD